MKLPCSNKSDEDYLKVDLNKMPRMQQELTACVQCGYCISVCEAHNQTPWESVTPRGKIYYLNQLSNAGGLDGVLKREVSLNPYFVDAMYKCTGCGNCEEVCHANIPLVELWEKARKWLVDSGVGPMKAHKGMASKVKSVHNPYGEDPKKRGNWWPEDVEKAEVPDAIFFAGCTGSYRQQTVPQLGVRVLNRANVKMNILGEDEWCCTSPLLRTGNNSESLNHAEKIVEKADNMGSKDMVMTCAGCYKTVSTDFGKYYAKTGQNVYHFAQYVEKLLNEKKLTINHEYPAKVTYHDPCHLGRHSGVFDAPRNVIGKIKGMELVEMDKNRENSRCCGAGGGYKSQYNDFAVNIAAERIRDAEETGAEILITCCPFCVTNLSQGAKKINSKIKVMDLAEILIEVTAPKDAPAPGGDASPKADRATVKSEPQITVPATQTETNTEAPEVILDDSEFTDHSPEAQVRRAAWNLGLRCRRDYGDCNVPVAFVKSKVAVFVNSEGTADRAKIKALEDDGWIVLLFKDADVTDGEKQAEQIKDAVKTNLKELKKKK